MGRGGSDRLEVIDLLVAKRVILTIHILPSLFHFLVCVFDHMSTFNCCTFDLIFTKQSFTSFFFFKIHGLFCF